MKPLAAACVVLIGLAAPAWADAYPVSGRWGAGAGAEKGPIDCSNKRVIGFNDGQRTDSNGGVPAYRNRSVTPDGTARYRVVDEFSTGQISNAHTSYTLRQVDNDRIEMNMQQGGTLTLQRCR
jgi:hypothetical protein